MTAVLFALVAVGVLFTLICDDAAPSRDGFESDYDPEDNL